MLLAAFGCQQPQPVDQFAPRKAPHKEEWVVEQDGERLGRVVLLEIQNPTGPVLRYEVLNRSEQRLGHIDAAGRVYRREPFAEDAVYLGMYPMDEAMGLLFERERPIQMLTLAEFRARESAMEASQDRQQPVVPRSGAPE